MQLESKGLQLNFCRPFLPKPLSSPRPVTPDFLKIMYILGVTINSFTYKNYLGRGMCSVQRACLADTRPLAHSPAPQNINKLDYVINGLNRKRIFYKTYNTGYLPMLSTEDNKEAIYQPNNAENCQTIINHLRITKLMSSPHTAHAQLSPSFL